MALFDFISKALGIPTDKEPILTQQDVQQISNNQGRQLRPGDPYSGYVYTCVNAIAEKISEIDLQLVKTVKGEEEIIHDHPALELLDKVNSYTTSLLMWQRVGALMELEGKDYWAVWKDNRDQPAEIQLLDPCRITPQVDTYGSLLGYKYRLNGGQTLALPADMVVPFLNLDPYNPYNGKSTLSAALLAAESNNLAGQFTANQLKAGGRPDVILKFNTSLTEEQKSQLKNEWKNQYGSVANAGKMMIAPNGLTVEQLTQSQIDMQMIEQRQYSRDEIMAIFRVPKSILGITDDVNRANADAANYAFMEFNIIPKMRRILAFMNEFYLPMFADSADLKFKLLNQAPKDELQTLDRYQNGLNNGWLSINDVRRAESMPLIQGGEMVNIGFGLTPLGEPEAVKAIKPLARKDFFGAKKLANILADAMAKKFPPTEIKEVEKAPEPKKAHYPLNWEGTQSDRIALLGQEFEDLGQAKGKKRDELLAPFEAQYRDASNQLFDDQMKRAISNLKKQKGKFAKKDPVKLLDPNQEIKITFELFKPILTGLMTTAGQAALNEVGGKQDFDSNKASEFIKKSTMRLATSMTQKTTEDLANLIATGNANGESIDTLTSRIVDYSGFDESRAETIARTETIRGSSQADIEGWKQSGVVKSKTWYTALDERVCPECMLMHGTEVDLEDDFLDDDGLLEIGIEPYGNGLDSPPLHPNCRCVLIPNIDDSGDDE